MPSPPQSLKVLKYRKAHLVLSRLIPGPSTLALFKNLLHVPLLQGNYLSEAFLLCPWFSKNITNLKYFHLKLCNFLKKSPPLCLPTNTCKLPVYSHLQIHIIFVTFSISFIKLFFSFFFYFSAGFSLKASFISFLSFHTHTHTVCCTLLP